MPQAFSSTFLGLKLAPEVLLKSTHNVFSQSQYADQFVFIVSKLWMPGPGDCIFQHLIEPEACPDGGIKKYPYCFSKDHYADQHTQNLCLQLENYGRQGLGTAFSNTLLSLKLAPKVVSKSTFNVFSQCQYDDQNTQNSHLQLQNSGCQGLRTAFSNTFQSLRSALRVLP